MLVSIGLFDWFDTTSNPFAQTYHWYNGYLYNGLNIYDDYANIVFYAIYLLLIIGLFRAKSLSNRIFLKNFLLVQLLFTLVAIQGLKYIVGEPRPYMGDDIAPQPFSSERDYHSFPSAHTAETIAIASPLAYYSRRLSVTLLWGILAATMSFCRIYFMQHDIFDVMGSILIGIMASYMIVKKTHYDVLTATNTLYLTPFSEWPFKFKKNNQQSK